MDDLPQDRAPAGAGAPGPAPAQGGIDLANRSLADALRVSFGILRLAMLVLAALFAVSGWFNVSEGEVVVRCRFGAIVGEPGREVLKPGGPYFALPAPVDEVVRVPTTIQQLVLDRAFWFEVDSADLARPLDQITPPAGGLVPGRDGSLLTGDQNIVHARWTVTYQVREENVPQFVRNVTTRDRAEQLVRSAAEHGIVRVVGQSPADELIRGQFDGSAAQRMIQEALDRAESGITLAGVSLRQPTPPLAVRSAFLEVGVAESEKGEKIEAAERTRTRTQNEVAGAGYRALSHAIDAYEDARRAADATRGALLEGVIGRLLEGDPAADALRPWLDGEEDAARQAVLRGLATADRVGGRVSEIINEARSYRTQIMAELRSEAETFARLLPIYQEEPELVRERLWRQARETILSGDVETFYLPDDDGKTLILELNRDPAVRRKREQERLRRQEPEVR